MVGRPAAVTPEEVFKAVKDIPVLNEKNKVTNEKDSVWQDGCKRLKYKITCKNLYTRVYENRNYLFDLLVEYKKNLKNSQCEDTQQNITISTSPKISSNDNEKSLLVDTIEEIRKIRSDVAFYHIFKEISAKPFHIIYWIPDQIDLLKDVKKKFGSRINLGLSDKLLKKGSIYNNETENLIYFFMFDVIEGIFLPFAQIITERKSKEFVEYFFCELLKTIKSVPHFCTIPSVLLLDAACIAFNHCSLEEYCMQCHKFLEINELPSPVCVITADKILIITLFKFITETCIDADLTSIKEFYLRCFILLTTINNYEKFIFFVRNIMVLLKKKLEDNEFTEARSTLLHEISKNFISDIKKNSESIPDSCMTQELFNYDEILKNLQNRKHLNQIYEYFKTLSTKITINNNLDTNFDSYTSVNPTKIVTC